MITAKEINNKRFEQTRPGYRPDEVDDFLREIAVQLSQVQKDKEETEKKIEVLVESVRQYKKDEEALKDALIGAQKQGRAVISEAQEKADKILADARIKADEIIGNTRVQLEKEKHCLVKMQQEVSEFKANLLEMYKAHLSQITSIPDFDDEEEEIEDTPVPQSEVSAPQQNVQAVNPTEPVNMEATKVMEKNAFPFSDSSAIKPENKFSNLKFGQNK